MVMTGKPGVASPWGYKQSNITERQNNKKEMSYQIFKRHGRTPKYIFLNESSQSGNTTYCMNSNYMHPEKGKSIVTIKNKKSSGCQGEQEREG